MTPASRRLSLVSGLKYFPRSFVYKVEAMDWALKLQGPLAEQNSRIDDTVRRDGARLRNFIRLRVADDGEAEEILQEVFYELVETYRLMKPIEQVSAWLFRVARNRITDLFRK